MMRLGISALLTIITLMCLPGCVNKPSDKDLAIVPADQALEIVQGKKSLLGLGDQTAVWIDSRTPVNFRAGHIPNAINLPYERVSSDHRRLNEYDILIVYGNDYDDPRAVGMSKRLIELGHSDVRTLLGGLRAWKDQDRPIETGE